MSSRNVSGHWLRRASARKLVRHRHFNDFSSGPIASDIEWLTTNRRTAERGHSTLFSLNFHVIVLMPQLTISKQRWTLAYALTRLASARVRGSELVRSRGVGHYATQPIAPHALCFTTQFAVIEKQIFFSALCFAFSHIFYAGAYVLRSCVRSLGSRFTFPFFGVSDVVYRLLLCGDGGIEGRPLCLYAFSAVLSNFFISKIKVKASYFLLYLGRAFFALTLPLRSETFSFFPISLLLLARSCSAFAVWLLVCVPQFGWWVDCWSLDCVVLALSLCFLLPFYYYFLICIASLPLFHF